MTAGQTQDRRTLEDMVAGLEEVLDEVLRHSKCRYPSRSTFLFRVEFQWFLMELSVLRADRKLTHSD